jgi:Cu(I)/Ag(I) efflux system protein CusF
MNPLLIASLTLILGQTALAAEPMSMSPERPGTHAEAAPSARASGTVKAIDSVKGRVTLAHGAVPSLHWPAMTMDFAATPEQLQGLKVGDRVEFEFHAEGMNARILSIRPAP